MLDFLELFTKAITGGAFFNDLIKKKPWFSDRPFITKLISYTLFPLLVITLVIIVFNIKRLLF